VLAKLQAPFIADAAKRLARYDAQWERLVVSGYSQYPWEVALNGLLQSSEGWGPSKNQLIAGHPFVGFGSGNVLGKGDTQPHAAAIVGLEVAGYLRYLSDFRQHIGVGIAGTSTNLSWRERSWGPTLHVSGFAAGYAYGFHSEEHTFYVIVDVTRGIGQSRLAKQAQQKVFRRYLLD
jgi:hypothetical protein